MGVAVLVRSLGQRVLANWIWKEIRLRSNFDYDPEIFALLKDHFVLRLRSAADYSLVKLGGPWFVARQLLAMED